MDLMKESGLPFLWVKYFRQIEECFRPIIIYLYCRIKSTYLTSFKLINMLSIFLKKEL